MKKLIIVLLAVCMSVSAFAKDKEKPKPEELLEMIKALQDQVIDLQGQINGNKAGIATNVTGISTNSVGVAANASGMGVNSTSITANASNIATNVSAIAAIPAPFSGNHADLTNVTPVQHHADESNSVMALEDLLDGVYRDDTAEYETLVFSGMNVQIVNGSGETSVTDGMGNLIIGYNEYLYRGIDDRTGSHNLIIGDYNEYTANSYGGMVVGKFNEIDGAYSSVSGGTSNTASGYGSSVTAGEYNTASGSYSSVSGGGINQASGYNSSVSGGAGNTARGEYSTVFGGRRVVAWSTSKYGIYPLPRNELLGVNYGYHSPNN